jgi:site-specific recombinase XerD
VRISVGLEDVDTGDVAGFVLYLRTRGYSQATIARKVAAVKSFFRFASESGLVDTNPALALDSPSDAYREETSSPAVLNSSPSPVASWRCAFLAPSRLMVHPCP